MSKSIRLNIPLYLHVVKAGFPSPAEDFVDVKIDLNEYLITNAASTFLLRVSGNSMRDLGILSGDILVVDKSLKVSDDFIVIASINGDFTVKRVKKIKGKLFLLPANSEFRPIEVNESDDFQIWGVVTHAIHSYNKRD